MNSARPAGTPFRSRIRFILWLPVCGYLSVLGVSAEPLMRVIDGQSAGTELLPNGGFEEASEANPRGWQPAPNRFALTQGQGRGNSAAIKCENRDERTWTGVSQTLTLNRTSPVPLVVRGWSRAKAVSGTADNDYSIYVDLIYTDGTPLWGQTANFRTGTHDWQERQVVILPQKPVRSVTVHCLLRHHTGTAWFDDVSVHELQSTGGAFVFQGVPAIPLPPQKTKRANPAALKTQDGLELVWRDNVVESLKVQGSELAVAAPSGFMARDVALNSGFFGFSQGTCDDLGLKLESRCTAASDHMVFEGRLLDTRGQDRAVTLVFALPLNAAGWNWGDDIRRSRVIGGIEDFENPVSVHCGATGSMSLYPLGALAGTNEGLAIALDMGRPAHFRIGYHAGTKQFYIAYDFALVDETRRFPHAADFRFVLFRFEPRWGFRSAWAKLMKIFPDYFEVRSRDQGLWMPFTDVSTVQDWQDFGFRYHEGNNNVAWDDAHGILSFRYTEPMTWWMPMAKEMPRTVEAALRERDRLAHEGGGANREMANVSYTAAMYDETGGPALLFRNEPWCNGAVWSLNPNPELPAGMDSAHATSFNAATVHWNEKLYKRLYGPEAKAHLNGEYLDSLEGYVTADLNFRRDHFRDTSVPLTFSSDSFQPALFKGLAVFEFTRWIGQEVHRLGKLTFANGVPYRFTYLCPWLDVLGTETDWVQNGKYTPVSDSQMCLWRTLAGGKPYLLLMNTDYDVFTPAMVERYFQRSLFYGMFPGMFSHNAAENPYWQNPKWYNRDRPLFKKYLPIIKRVAEAGWRPVPAASCDNTRILLERFGPNSTGTAYIMAFNDTETEQRGRLRVDATLLPMSGEPSIVEELSAKPITRSPEIALAPQEVQVFRLHTSASGQ